VLKVLLNANQPTNLYHSGGGVATANLLQLLLGCVTGCATSYEEHIKVTV